MLYRFEIEDRSDTICWKNRCAQRKKTDLLLRAPTVDVGYVPNAKYLAHIPHQTQKIGFSRCCICCIILAHIPFCVRTVANLQCYGYMW